MQERDGDSSVSVHFKHRERERERKRDKGDRIGEREEILKWRNTELKGAGEMT